MKKILFLLLITAISGSFLYGQTENVGVNTTSPDNSASLHVTYVTTPKGILIPRMDNTARGNIVSPANGLLIFNTTSNRFEVYDLGATTWRGLITDNTLSNSAWSRTGNTGTVPGTDFIGTTDNTAFTLYTNNSERLRINANGNFGVGSNNPSALLSVGTTSQFQVNGTGAINAATGITSSGNITFSGLNANEFVRTGAGGILSTYTFSQDLSVLADGTATVTGIRGRNVTATLPTNGQVLKWNSSLSSWVPDSDIGSAIGGNTLDQAYDEGGSGSGRTISVTNGAVQLNGSNAADETIEITTTGNGGLAFLENTGSGTTLTINDEASDATPFTIDADGQVGVMTSSPSAAFDVDSTFKLGSNGNTLSSIIKRTVTIDVGNIGAGSNRIETITFTGARDDGVVTVSPSGSIGPDIILAYAFVSADDEIKIVFFNIDTASYNPSSQEYHITVIN